MAMQVDPVTGEIWYSDTGFVPSPSYLQGQEPAWGIQARGPVTPQIMQAGLGAVGIPAALAAVAPALAAVPVVGGVLAGAAGLAAAGYGAYQALGGGEGGGLFGLNILGGDDMVLAGVPFGGPGLPEPKVPYKEWHITINGTTIQFYRVSTARGTRMFAYNTRTKVWKTWIPQKMAVIGKNLPSHRNLVRLRKNLRRHSADARTILKLTSPKSLREARRHHFHRRG